MTQSDMLTWQDGMYNMYMYMYTLGKHEHVHVRHVFAHFRILPLG